MILRTTILVVLCLVTAIGTPVFGAGVLRVPQDFATIQAAIDATQNGDTVVVAPGNYTDNGNRDLDFKGKAITVRCTDPNDPAVVAATVIDCFGASHRGFYFRSNEGPNSVVAGFTVINGTALSGGAIYCYDSSPTITCCVIRDNTNAYWNRSGGGIYCHNSNAIIANCTIANNNSPSSAGGGIYCGGGNPVISNCIISNNSASYGGGLCDDGAHVTVTNCVFSGNFASQGGAVCNWPKGSLTLTNCAFIGNVAGAIYSEYNNTRGGPNSTLVLLNNCTFAGNAAAAGSALLCGTWMPENPTEISLVNCILWDSGIEVANFNGSTITIAYSDVHSAIDTIFDPWQAVVWGAGNIDVDPCFVRLGHWDPNAKPGDPSSNLWVDGDYHLESQAGRWEPQSRTWVRDNVTSPCIDAGDPMSPVGPEPFPNGGRINMGAYGGTAEASKSYFGRPICQTIIAGDINGDCRVDWADLAIMSSHWLHGGEVAAPEEPGGGEEVPPR